MATTSLQELFPASTATFHQLPFTFPLNAKLHAINEDQSMFAFMLEDDSFLSKSYEICMLSCAQHPTSNNKTKTSRSKISTKATAMQFITIHNSSKSLSKERKTQYALVIGFETGRLNVMDADCTILFVQHMSNAPIRSISLHFDNVFYSYCPSLIINCHGGDALLFITADEIYRTVSHSLRARHKKYDASDMDAVIASLWSPKKIILTTSPAEIVQVVSVPPIDCMQHGIKGSLLEPEPSLNLYRSNQLFLIVVGYQPCITYVQIEKSSKGFGVREIKQGANKLVKSAFNLVTKSIGISSMFSSFWGSAPNNSRDDDDDDDDGEDGDNYGKSTSSSNNARSAAEESIRKLAGTRYKIQCSVRDEHRRIEQVILSPMREYAALIDSYGRISILDCRSCSLVRMFKGCRGAQCGWIQLNNNDSKNDSNKRSSSFALPWTLKHTLLLVIYIAPRGILEIYHLCIKQRLGALLFNTNGKLLYHLTLFQHAKQRSSGDPAHVFLCDYSNHGAMYELKLTVNAQDQTRRANLASAAAAVRHPALITFIAPVHSQPQGTKANSDRGDHANDDDETEHREDDDDGDGDEEGNVADAAMHKPTDSVELEDSDDDAEDEELPSAIALTADNFEATFLKYVASWKSYMADIPSALIQCARDERDSSDTQLLRYWNVLMAVELDHHSEIATFCDFLTHCLEQIVEYFEKHSQSASVMDDSATHVWRFQSASISSYKLLCTAYIQHCQKEMITIALTEWCAFWMSQYMKPMSRSAIVTTAAEQTTETSQTTDDAFDHQLLSVFLFGVISLSDDNKNNDSDHVDDDADEDDDDDDDDDDVNTLKSSQVPAMAMTIMKLPPSVTSLYLELFLFWFVTEKAHTWLWNGPPVDDDDEAQLADAAHRKQVKLQKHKLFEQQTGASHAGYFWSYLLDYDALHAWLSSSRVLFGELSADWTHQRFDELLSSPLNAIEERFVPTMRYFIHTGGQLLGILRDYVQNTTQLSHAFLLCRVADAIHNTNTSNAAGGNNDDGDSGSDTEDAAVNNEWFVLASRLLKTKLFAFLLDYNHHSQSHIAALNASQASQAISMRQILKNYYRSGYSLHDLESDLPISRLMAKYIVSQIESNVVHRKGHKKPNQNNNTAEHKKNDEEAMVTEQQRNEHFIDAMLFMFDMIDYIGTHKTYDYDGIVSYVRSQQTQLSIDYFDDEFIDSVLQNVYYVIRIVPSHLTLEWLIFYNLFDIYERIVSEEDVATQLALLHTFEVCCTKILQFYGSSNLSVQLQIVVLNGKLWYYVLSAMLNENVLHGNSNSSHVIACGVEWIKYMSQIVDGLVVLQQQNKHDLIDSNAIIGDDDEHSDATVKKDEMETKSDGAPSSSVSSSAQQTPHQTPQKKSHKSPSQREMESISSQITALKMNSLQISQHGQREIASFLSRGQGYQREKKHPHQDESELASWPPKFVAPAFVSSQFLQPGTLLFFTSRSLIYITHLQQILNEYLQILRLYFVAARAKVSVVAHSDADDKHEKSKPKTERQENKNALHLKQVFPDFKGFDSNLFSLECFQALNDDTSTQIRYDGVQSEKYKFVMLIAKKWIAGALDLASSWNLDANKVKRCIVIELCMNYRDDIGLQLIADDLEYNHLHDDSDTNHKQLLAQSLLHVVKKRICCLLNALLHSAQHQHILSGIPADSFQELLHYNDTFSEVETEMKEFIKMSVSDKDKKEIKRNPNKVLQMNLKLAVTINTLLQHNDFYHKNSKEQMNTLVQIINLLMHQT